MERGDYELLQDLEDLESLLEDLEEQGLSGLAAHENFPDELMERMEGLGVQNVQQVRERVMHLHAEIDRDEDELTISDS